jgi:alanine racemase
MLTWVEIKKANLLHNLQQFRTLIGDHPLLMPVIKANAYGHGILEVGELCDKATEVDRLCVASLAEALQLRDFFIKKPIQILSFFEFDEQKVSRAMQSNIIFPLYTLEQAAFLNTIGEKIGMKCRVHLKIDTGTSRIGVRLENLPEFLQVIKKSPSLNLEGLWSHFSSSESNRSITERQYRELILAESILKRQGIAVPLKHLAAALYPSFRLDAVRLGLGLYGLYPAPSIKKIIKLKPVLSWKTTILQIKTVRKGDKISYSGTYTMPNEGKIAVLPVGYADGYNRAWSNQADVLVNGTRCKVRGRVCMNLMMIEVTKVKKCAAGDTVTLLGPSLNEEITADELATLTPDTINYEISTNISPLLSRKVV